MMNETTKTITLMLLAAFPAAFAASAQGDTQRVRGEVIQVQLQQETQNQGEADTFTIRTRQGEQMRLRLGDAGQCGNCVQVGDQIRARVMTGSGGQAGQVQSMKVKRGGQMYGYKNQGGQMVGTHQRLRDGSGGGKQRGNSLGLGTGNCQGGGQRGGNRSGGGNRGGNGGGNGRG